MGVEYRGVLCVGYTYEQAQALYEECLDDGGNFKYDDIYDFCEGVGLTSYSPYFDADVEDCIYGDEVEASNDYNYAVVGENVDQRIKEVRERLKKEFLITPKAYIMAHGW